MNVARWRAVCCWLHWQSKTSARPAVLKDGSSSDDGKLWWQLETRVFVIFMIVVADIYFLIRQNLLTDLHFSYIGNAKLQRELLF